MLFQLKFANHCCSSHRFHCADITWDKLVNRIQPLTTKKSLSWIDKLRQLYKVAAVYPRLRFVSCAINSLLATLPSFCGLLTNSAEERAFWMSLGTSKEHLAFVNTRDINKAGRTLPATGLTEAPTVVCDAKPSDDHDAERLAMEADIESPPKEIKEALEQEAEEVKQADMLFANVTDAMATLDMSEGAGEDGLVDYDA